MIDITRLKQVYATLQKGGYSQDFGTFRKGFAGNENYANRKKVYDLLSANGAQIGKTYEEFMQNMQKPKSMGNPTVNKYRQQMFNSVDPTKNKASELTRKAVKTAHKAMDNVRKPVRGAVVNKQGKKVKEFDITPAKTLDDLNREYAHEVASDWEKEQQRQSLYNTTRSLDEVQRKIAERDAQLDEADNGFWTGIRHAAQGMNVTGGMFQQYDDDIRKELIDPKYKQYLVEANYLTQMKKQLIQEEEDAAAPNATKWDRFKHASSSFTSGMLDEAFGSDAFDFGGYNKIRESDVLLRISDRINRGVATDDDRRLLQILKDKEEIESRLDNDAYSFGRGVSQSAGFVTDFLITGGGDFGGLGRLGGKMALGLARKTFAKTMTKDLGKRFAAWSLKNLGKTLGEATGAAMTATSVQVGKTAANATQRYLGLDSDDGGLEYDKDGNLKFKGGTDVGTAIAKAIASGTIENYTELLGPHITSMGKRLFGWAGVGLEKITPDALSKFFDKVGSSELFKRIGTFTDEIANSKVLNAGKKALANVGVNDMPEEGLEEEAGIILNSLITGDNKFSDLWDKETQYKTWGGVMSMMGAMRAIPIAHSAVGTAYSASKNKVEYFKCKHDLTKAETLARQALGDKWTPIKELIDNADNKHIIEVGINIIRQSDKYSQEQAKAAQNYIGQLLKMRGFNNATMASIRDKNAKGEGQTDADKEDIEVSNSYAEGHEAEGELRHLIQLEYEKRTANLAKRLGLTPEKIDAMNVDSFSSYIGLNSDADFDIFQYKKAKAAYDGVMDNAQNLVDIAGEVAAQRVDNMTNVHDGTIRKAYKKCTEMNPDSPVYIISGNIKLNDDGSINYTDSDKMLVVYDEETGQREAIGNFMLASVDPNMQNAEEVKAQAIQSAKQKIITEQSNVIDGILAEGSEFTMESNDGSSHNYKIVQVDEQGNCIVSVDGTVLPEPLSLDAIQQQYDQSNVARSVKNDQTAQESEQTTQEPEQTTQEPEQIQQESQPIEDNFDYDKITNENDGKVKRVDVTDEEGKNRFPNAKAVFLIQDKGAMPKFVVMDEEGNLTSYVGKRGDKIHLKGEMTIDEYKKQRQEELQLIAAENADSSMIEDNSGTIEADRGGIEAENNESLTFEDGTPIPVDMNGEVDLSQADAAHAAEWYDNNLGEDADDWLDGEIKKAKKVLEQAKNKKLAGTKPSELVSSKKEKEAAIADAQAHYDSAISIRDSLKERRIAKEENTSEGRRNLIEKARRKFARLKSAVKDDAEAVAQIYKETVGSLLHRLYDGTGIDVTDTIPLTAEEYVASNLGAHSLNYEGTETSKSVKQETGLSREDFAKTQLLAADGKGTTIDALVHSLWENRPSNLDSLDTQDIRNALIGVLTSGFKASEARSFIENIRIAQAEKLIEEERTAAENAAYYEQQKAKEEEEKKKAELEKKAEDEKKKAEENIDLPAIDKQGEPINNNIIELAKWAKKQGLEIDSTSKLNSYADLFLMCKDGFGVSTLVPDEGKNINQVIYFPDNAEVIEQLGKLQEEFNAGRDLNHSSNIDSEITEGATFYDAATAKEFRDFVNEQTKFPDKLKEGSKAIEVPEDATDEKPLGEQRTDSPFSARKNGKQQTEAERAADVEKNKVDDVGLVDAVIGEKIRKSFERIAKMMGAKIQYQRTDKLGNGWIQETTDADGNVHRTIFITLDSSITEGAQFIFGHEMTHQIKNLNPAAYNELTQLVLDTYGSDAFDKAVDETMKRYSDAGFSGRSRDYYAEEVVADSVGEMIRDLNLAHTLAMKMSHPLLAAIHEILQKIKLAFFGTEYSDVTKNIIRSIEQAYVKTAKGEITNSETGEDVSFSLRQKPEPKKKGIGYKVFVLKDGKLYPPMVANPNGAATPVGVWLDADAAPIAGESKTGRPQVKQGGKGTQGGSGKLAYRPGWHLGVVPYAIQFNRKDAEGNKILFPKNFVFAEVEYAADVDYQEEARQEGINPSGKYQHSLAGLKHLPTDGFYMYRTNPNPETDPWVITGAMKVNRILTRAEQADLVSKAGREPQQIQEGDIVTDDVVNSINQEIADAPKFSLKVYHGSGADFTEQTKFSLRLKSAIDETETNPSDAQKESGNYKKGHIKFGGYDYTIENPKGSTRSGKDPNGKEWKVTMHDTYGYIRGKFGKDGDHLDMFINDKADLDNWDGDVFVVDQVNPDGSFDEHKVMYGYDSMNDAEKAYLANYSKGWQGLGNITGASKAEFDKWLDTSNRKLKPFADYAKVKFSQAQSVSEPRYSLKDIKPVGVGAFGNIYNQFRGNAKAAIEFLKKVRGGEAVGALHHKDIGDIDLVWGKEGTGHSDGYGLSKLVKYHPEVLDNLQEILNDMRVVSSSKNRVNLESETHKAGVRLTWDGERKSWLLTAFKKETSASDKRTDTAATSLEGDTALSQTEGSAAKIDNSSETTKENGEKFSLKDEKTMFGMHNISLDKLRKAIKQGGFAAPSMGVIDSKNGIYSGYGEITLIPKAEKIAKRTGKNIGTYAADAWTPIYPPVEKKFGGNGGDVAYDDIESVPKEMQRLTRNAINSFMDGREANGLAYLYLQEKGKAPELVHVEGKYPKELHDEVKGILGKLNGIYNTTDEQKEKLLDLFIREVYDGNKEEFDNDIKKFIKKDEELIKKRPNSNIAKNKQLDVDWMKEHGYDYGALSRFVDGILRDAETSGKVDENATMKAAQQYIQDKGMKEDFDSWKEKLNDRYNVEEVIFAGYKPDGNRKYLPNTVENAVKVMKQDGKNASVGSASFSHFVASILKPMGTLDQIRKKKGNLTGNYEDVEKFQEKWKPVYDELADKMQPDAEPFESYGMDRLEEVATQKNPKKYAKEEYGVDLTDEDINKLNELIEAVKNDKPSIYFETKFMRPYGLDEFEKAIVPNDTPSDVVDALKMAGIDVSSYERGNAEDRQKVTMDAINSSDNIRFSLKAEKEKIVADAKADGTYMTAPNGEKTKLDAEQWATVRTANFKNWFGDWENDPENASKVVDENGEPMVMYHYTDESFTIFGKDKEVGKNTFGNATNASYAATTTIGHWFTSNKKQPEYMGKPMACFLNIVEPFDGYTLEGLADYLNNYISDEDFNSYEEDYENVAPIIEAGNNFREEQIRDGYDGVVIDDEEFGGTSYVAFNANQIKSAENNNGDFSADNNDIRFSLAGERGAAAADKAEERTFRMDNLSVARKMEEEKKDAKAIKMATGWERGADGKWRYEMPDAKIKDTMDVGGGQIVKRYEEDMLWNGGKLSKVIDAPELFKAYPQLKDVRIETDAIMNDMPSNGEYNSKTNTITIHADELKYMNGILNHEIQHAIQDIEGFAKGGSPRLVRGEVKKRFDEVTKQIKQLRAEGKEDEAKALIEKNRSLYNAYMKNDDFDSYKSLAGEVEARNVSARLNMTPEERRKTLAESTEDVARKDQIFLGVGDVSFSLHDMADGKESGAADMAEDLKSLNTPDEVDDAIKTAIDDMPSGWKMANRKMIHIAQALGENRKAEIAGEEPKFSLKDGTLIKAGTYFSGGGLVEEGLKGIIDPVVAVEYDEKISGVYRNNFGQHIVTADVRDVDPKELVKQIDGEVEYFHASPVCKNYSQAKSNHAEVELDKETAASTAEFINAIKPKVVTIENVKGYKDSDAMKTITDALDANGYTWDADVYNAADYGGYTNRERLIVRAVRDGKLPEKPKKMARKSGWYEAVADIIPTLTEKKNGVAPWMDIRLKADGIDWRNIDKPLYVMGSAYADGKIPHAFADELLPTLRTKSGDVIVMPDGKVYRAMGRVLARVSGVSDDYKMPFSENLSHTIIGNGIPTQLTEHVIAPLLQNTLRPTTPEDGNTKFSLRGSTPYDKQMEEWMEKNHLEKGAVPMEKPVMKEGENIFDYANRMVEWTRNQNLWKTAPKQTGFQDALDKWKADNGLSPDAYPPVRPHRENYSTEIGYTEDLEEYNKKKELWKSAPKPKDFDLSVDLEDMNKQLRNIRRAVLNQKNYDQRTIKAVSDLVRKMLNIGWGDGLSRGNVVNLLSAAKNATGANDVKKYLDKAMGILAENYLNRLSTAYDNLINTKGARADQSGVIKMGSLDANGQAFMSEYKKAINMDDKSLNNYVANIEEDSAKNEDNVEMNDYRLAGIQAAIMYKQQIGGNDADIAELQRQIGELKNKKDATKEDKDLLKSLEKKLFENKFDRITMYENLLNNIQRMVKESKGRAKEFREEIAEHKNEILHLANLDLEGVDSTYYDTTNAKKKLVNNDLQRAVFSSTYTFEQFLKFFGKKAANGEGRLYNYFTKLNQDALDEEQLYNEMNRNALDEKTKELFGKKKFMNLVGIDGNGMKEMDIEVTDYSNKKTGKRTIHLKQGQMLYIYLVNKETDGEMKLRAMGITEEDVAAIEENLDPRVKAMGEWLQDEYLPECQRRYQATHTKYFGAPMKEVENYFPLAINNRARNVKEDVNQDSDAMSQLAGTSTGAIVTRRVNVIPLDIENADAFEVAFNHLQEMEEWSAMLPFRQDINTLLSYTHFRNQVQNMSSVAYGSGKTLWDEFKQTAQIAAGTYKPKVNAGMMDSRIAAAMGGIAVAKISGRLWTAIKQSQSATVFLPECDFIRFVKNGVNPYGSWKWAMENIPDFRKRVENMTYGDVKLRQYLDELEKWHDWTKTISKIGMAPNILVDGITCAVGARSVYETEVNRLTKLGYPKEKAEEKAYYKAVAAYNKTQQSSGGMYLSPMQVDRTYVSAALSLFKNANYAYGRMQIEACRGLARTYDFWGGKHKTTLIESMTRQIMEEDGLDENTARAIAKATYNRTFRQSIGRLINFATLVPVSWALYKVLPYLLTGDDDDKKKDMIEEAVIKGFATSLSDNYVIPFASNILNAGLKVEDGKPTFDPEVFRYQNLYINPATSDLANIYSMVGNQKWYSVANKLGMLGVQSLIGFNPETVGALYQALSEADYDNGNTAKEWQIGILKAISAPEESIRELYMDELGLKSGDIKKIPLAELEKRYAERQINRDNLLSQVFMDAEDFNGYVDKYQKSFEKKIKDKMDKWDEYDKKKADEFFDTTSDPKLKDMIEKKRAKDANAAADEQIAKEGLNQEKNGKEPSEKAYDAVKMSIDVAEDNAISTYNKVLNKRYAALNDEYNNQTDAMKYIFMSKHPNFKAYKELESEYTNYGKKIKELKEKLVSADGYDAKQTILKQIRAEREKFSELQSKVR